MIEWEQRRLQIYRGVEKESSVKELPFLAGSGVEKEMFSPHADTLDIGDLEDVESVKSDRSD